MTSRSRRIRYRRFESEVRPGPSDTILDVGVTDSGWRSGNFLEAMYPWPERITAVGLGPLPEFQRLFPSVTAVTADGRALPFPDQSFTVGFSNAVIEHVGGRDDQRRFVGELVRTCERSFVATPNRWFPIDPHTLLPFVHWLPRRFRDRLLRWTGNGKWAGEGALNPLGARDLASLYPDPATVRIVRQRLLGLTTVLIAIVDGDRA
ncbi:MAG TPA: methyltransferase domain-containing protein [Candidatus Limnocylindrales bacterium]